MSEPELRPAQGRRPMVLVVEDDPLIRMTVEVFLEEGGFVPVVTDGPESALALGEAALAAIDAVVTDMVMPGMSGGELAVALREKRPGLPVVYMSAYPAEVLVAEGRLEAGQPTLLKPFSEVELVAKVREVLAA